MLIYNNERDDGLEEILNNSRSLSYLTLLQPANERELNKSLASVKQIEYAHERDIDLYFVKSILVTTAWNKNDDVFDRKETWLARYTPTHKPTNIEHDERQITGHIADCWVMDGEGKIVDNNTSVDDLPDKFHLVTGSVIYKNWEADDLQKRAEKLIERIEAGKKYVSMEVLFRDFDYVFFNTDGTSEIKQRNDESSWLTKYLRVYGGVGVYEGRKIGRLLRNMTFCGKGYVDKPANPESVIIFEDTNLLNFNESGVNKDITCSKSKGDVMAEKDELLTTQNTELRQALADAQNELKELKNQLAEANVAEYTSKIEKLEKELAETKQSFDDIKGDKEKTDTELASLQSTLDELKKEKSDLNEKLTQIEKEKMIATRISTLVDGGMDKEAATKKVGVFADLSDEQFKVIADELIDTIKARAESKNEDEDDDESDKADANADTNTIDSAEASEDEDLNIDTENKDKETETIRKNLAKAFAARMGREDTEGDN